MRFFPGRSEDGRAGARGARSGRDPAAGVSAALHRRLGGGSAWPDGRAWPPTAAPGLAAAAQHGPVSAVPLLAWGAPAHPGPRTFPTASLPIYIPLVIPHASYFCAPLPSTHTQPCLPGRSEIIISTPSSFWAEQLESYLSCLPASAQRQLRTSHTIMWFLDRKIKGLPCRRARGAHLASP